MTQICPPPCDHAVIRSAADCPPCKARTGRWVLAATIVGSSMAFVDGTVVNVALPVLQAELDVSVAGLQWIIESYMLIHTIDLALSLAGPVSAVVAVGGTTPIHRMESEDFVAAGIRFASGAHGSMMATTSLYPGGPERIELICTRATAVLSAGGLAVCHHDGRKENIGETRGSGGGADPMDFPHDAHRALHADFISAISNQRAPRVTGRATLQVHRFIDAIIKAAKDMTPIRLSRD